MKPIFRYCWLSVIAIALVVAGRLAFEGVSQEKDAIYLIPLIIFSAITTTAYISKMELKYKWPAFLFPLVATAIIMRFTVGVPAIF
ncbi:hypothetical protein [Trueperella sp. LYQ143]|uniref:hypothetical protein n=1 Tax=unclassified Trueperella TaxID=2630174 RepID=UPI00398331DF